MTVIYDNCDREACVYTTVCVSTRVDRCNLKLVVMLTKFLLIKGILNQFHFIIVFHAPGYHAACLHFSFLTMVVVHRSQSIGHLSVIENLHAQAGAQRNRYERSSSSSSPCRMFWRWHPAVSLNLCLQIKCDASHRGLVDYVRVHEPEVVKRYAM